jgi:hypothetical protein
MHDQQHSTIYGANRVIALFACFINTVFLEDEIRIMKHLGGDFKTNAVMLCLVR